MNKSVKIISFLAAAFMLAGCANTDSENIISGNPFEETEPSVTDDYEEAFGKYQMGSIKYSNYNVEGGSVIEYSGGNIELSFDADTGGNKYDVEMGYMAFINGIPQQLSLNGGKSGELVCVSQAPNKNDKVTLSISPVITEELSGEDTLQLKLISIFNPSYKPSDSFTGFGNAHTGQSFLEYDIRVNSSLQQAENLTALIEYESILIDDETIRQYGIKKSEIGSPTSVIVKEAGKRSGEQLSFKEGKTNAELLIYGGETYEHRVYVYVDHKRVKFNGCDYLETEVKSGYLNVLGLELDNISERDIVYAIAVPENSETGSMAARKSGSMLVIRPDTFQSNSQNPQSPNQTTNVPTDVHKVTDIYSYQPVGYIDDGLRYLLLSRPSFRAEDNSYFDYIVYDETEKAVIGTLNAPGSFHSMTYGGGVITLGITYKTDDENMNEIKVAVYNEKLQLIKEVYNSDISEIYIQKYDPIADRWYFHDEEEYFCRADGDFSNITKLMNMPHSTLRDYYITDDAIIYYKTVYDYSDPDSNADIFGIMDLDGNVISETKIASYGAGEFRIGKAGDDIYLISPFMQDTDGLIREPIKGIIFYNIKTKEQKIIYPEDDNEKSYCMVTPQSLIHICRCRRKDL
ncbi:MAG: hypothetical protein K2K41_03450, partial [Ruminiclostridium sp.]|nr:hypothetical protein [Ruminiclostridium sp.]